MKMRHFFYMWFNAHNMQHDVASCELKFLLQLLKRRQVINDIKISLRNYTLHPPVVRTGSPVEHTSITTACLPREDKMIYQSVLWGAALVMQSDTSCELEAELSDRGYSRNNFHSHFLSHFPFAAKSILLELLWSPWCFPLHISICFIRFPLFHYRFLACLYSRPILVDLIFQLLWKFKFCM